MCAHPSAKNVGPVPASSHAKNDQRAKFVFSHDGRVKTWKHAK
jgi:hypothetical protein